jgi:hypothetical protein
MLFSLTLLPDYPTPRPVKHMPPMRIGPALVCKLKGWNLCGEVHSAAPLVKNREQTPEIAAAVSNWRISTRLA